MARLLDDLLEVSRIAQGKLELRKQRLVLQNSLIEAAETVRPLIEAHRHELTIDLPPVPVPIDADPVRFAQIFSNLLTNSAKYTEDGGVIHIQAKLVKTRVVITVRDNGIGISADLLPRVFELFAQAKPALERAEGGLGIGLSLVRRLVILHSGSIEARSSGEGKGSEFIVTLPVSQSETPLEPASPVSAGAVDTLHSLGVRVLVVDDNRDSADACSLLLQTCGYEVRTAYSGQEALAITDGFRPKIALLDVGMPGMNGYEVARRLREKWAADVILVAVTGWGQAEDKRKTQAAGFDHHVTKPVNFDVLARLLAQYPDA
jgi:CheY-like chemotaxis protein/two-component sensor histidine kinase